MNWDQKFIDLAKFVRQWSKDPSTKVGAVVVGETNNLVALGYNGFPPGIEDSEERLNNREIKYKLIQHAERNALENAKFKPITLYVTLPPCPECAKSLINLGVKRIVYLKGDRDRWNEEFKISKMMFDEVGIVVEELNE